MEEDDNTAIVRQKASEVQEYTKNEMEKFTKHHVKFNCFTLHNLLINQNMREDTSNNDADDN
jgi:hypothetical protein